MVSGACVSNMLDHKAVQTNNVVELMIKQQRAVRGQIRAVEFEPHTRVKFNPSAALKLPFSRKV